MFRFSCIKDYHNALMNGEATCVEAVHFYLQQIDSTTQLNAFVEVFTEEALARAGELDAQRAQQGIQGKLHGVVIGIKDVISYKGHTLTAASHILEGFQAIYSATAIEQLLAEGAIIIGRQNCDEFAMGSSNENSTYGPVLNALDETRVPGGSSGGSAVAVQAGLCMIALGSDTGGSVRQPADFCGIIGLKPSYGRISRYGLIAYASSFDQIGIFGTNVEDVALALEVMSGADEYDSTVSNAPVPEAKALETADATSYKLAYFKESVDHPGLDPEIRTAFLAFTEKLTKAGHQVQAVDFELLDFVVPTYYILTTAEASSNLSRYDGVKFGYRSKTESDDLSVFYKQNRSEGFGKEVKRRIMLGTFVLSSGYYDAYFTKAQQVRQLLTRKTQTVFNNFDAILSPTVPAPAFRIGEKSNDPIEMFLADIYTVFANLVGIPGISLPLFQHSIGMPFGMQVMTSQMNEVTLLRLSKKLMQFREQK